MGEPTTGYVLQVHLPEEPDEADARVREALADEGFGVLADIDVQATLRSKLGEDVGAYRILGACNPEMGRRAIAADADVGALLPCNVVLRAGADGGTDVLAADPERLITLSDAEGMDELAAEVRAGLERIVERLRAG